MAQEASVPVADPRNLSTPELIDRLATAMRLSSGLDLPHGYFVAQVKLKLAGKGGHDESLSEEDRQQWTENHRRYASSDCFAAWAMRE